MSGDRRALIDFTAEMFSGKPVDLWNRDLGPMLNALAVFGIEIIGTAPSPYFPDAVCRFVVTGNGLPAECAEGWRLVRPTFQQDTHGNQRIVKVIKLEVVGKPNLVLAA